MAHVPQVKIPATYMRGGTSKGVFFRLQDLPPSCQVPYAIGETSSSLRPKRTRRWAENAMDRECPSASWAKPCSESAVPSWRSATLAVDMTKETG